jgi:four helix bundle protein
MKYSRFEELPVWNASIELALRIYKLTQDPSFLRQRSLRDQLERAAVSISNNIAEGFERGTTQELLTFIYIARGSAGEVRSMLNLIERLPSFSHLKSAAEEIPRQLRAWADFLQNTTIKGHRHLNSKVRGIDKRKQEREEMIKELKRVQTGSSA